MRRAQDILEAVDSTLTACPPPETTPHLRGFERVAPEHTSDAAPPTFWIVWSE